MNRKLRWGLLSTARINQAVIPPIRASHRSEVFAVASRDSSKADAYAREWNIPQAYDSYEALLDDPQIDVIYNSLPNSMHGEWTVRALQAGKHVLCEKPLAISVEEVDAIRQAASENQRVAAEAFMYRHHPQTRMVKKMLEDGALGDLKLVRGCFSYVYSRPRGFHFDPSLGGGSIWDIGCYPISYARYGVGEEPQEVFAWQVEADTGVDELFFGQMRFPSGVVAQFDSGFRMVHRTEVEFIGDVASLTVLTPYKPGKSETMLLKAKDGSIKEMTVKGQELYLGEVQDMEDAVLLGKEPAVSLLDSRGNVAAICALLESARQGRVVPL